MAEYQREFPNTGNDFSGLCAAEAWLTERGFSIGPMQRDDPQGILYGRFHIAKWRHLTTAERRQLQGTIEALRGDKRAGVVVKLRNLPEAVLELEVK